MSVPKEYNLKRHYKTRRKSRYEQYEGDAVVAVLQDLKSKYNEQISCMANFTKTNLSDKKAFYEVSLIPAKNGKVFRKRETVKKCTIKVVLAFGDTKMAKKLLKLYFFPTKLSQG